MDSLLVCMSMLLLLVSVIEVFIPFLPGLVCTYFSLILFSFTRWGESLNSWGFLVFWTGLCAVFFFFDFFVPPLMLRWAGGSRTSEKTAFWA